ncbi:MAG: hypothetical protein WBD40_20830 [Tepidisphaeraceae bacterium]
MNRFAFRVLIIAIACCAVAAVASAAERSKLVFPAKDGKLQYAPDGNGNAIPDFSHCGYMGGGVAIPDVPVKVTLKPEKGANGDDTQRIQNAIDEVAKLSPDQNGIRGAVLLRKGTYRVAGQLKITTGGVVLRGEGDGDNGTTLFAVGKQRRALIDVKGESGAKDDEASATKITSDVVPVGARRFDVADATGFKVGDLVTVRRVGNTAWISAIGMDKIQMRPGGSGTKQWTAFDMDFERIITDIKGNQVTVDAPIVCAIESKWGGGSLMKCEDAGRIEQVGIEHLRGVSEFDPSVKKKQGDRDYLADDEHADYLASFDNVRNGWLRNATTRHFFHGPVTLRGGAKWITVADCKSLEPVGTITGGTRYPFSYQGQQLLTIGCYSSEARHAFVVGSRVPGPNAFVDCTSERDYGNSEPHHRWSVGGLYDNVKGKIAIQDRQWMGSGHGWSGANYVTWNCQGTMIAQSPPTANTWVVGFVGEKDKPAFERPDATWEATGRHVEPRSLYLKQLEDRLGAKAVENIAGKAGK